MQASEERWLPIPGYEDNYQVSDLGRVLSRPRPRTRGGLLKTPPDRDGYPQVGLQRDGHQKVYRVHVLVALAFLGPRPDDMEVRHLDGNSGRPMLTNLAYGTRSENRRDQLMHGTDGNVEKDCCPKGHRYSAGNVRRIPSRPDARYCRACEIERGYGPRWATEGHPDYDPQRTAEWFAEWVTA
jgi:hypothetical protein